MSEAAQTATEAPQTAEQVNLPQTGKVDLPPPPPAFVPGASTGPAPAAKPPMTAKVGAQPVPLIPKTPAAVMPMRPAPQPGWWKVDNIKGSRAALVKYVGNHPDMPAHWKALLQAEIAAHTSEALVISAHCCQQNPKAIVDGAPVMQKGKVLLHLDISPLEGLQPE